MSQTQIRYRAMYRRYGAYLLAAVLAALWFGIGSVTTNVKKAYNPVTDTITLSVAQIGQ